MFRSKAPELPSPQRPSWEDMEEDLKNSKKSDVVFTLAKTTLGTVFVVFICINALLGNEEAND